MKVVKACLPDPASLAPDYTGKTCIGNLVKGEKDGRQREVFIYNVCDHRACYEEVESQAISYTAGVPPVAAAILIAQGPGIQSPWSTLRNSHPDPFLELLGTMRRPLQTVSEGVASCPDRDR